MNIMAVARLLTLTVGFTVFLIAFRIFYSGNLTYIFFAWNLFLAGIPLAINLLLVTLKNKNARWPLLALWLLFFPNALYIVTDLVHLKARYPVPLWFDIVIVFSAAVNGLIMAYISLRQVELFVSRKLGSRPAQVVSLCCLLLGSFGIYIGRYLRWNSWDVVTNPFALTQELLPHLFDPLQHLHTWGMTILLTLFFSVFYFTIKSLPVTIIKE